jgi:hypothetical protein
MTAIARRISIMRMTFASHGSPRDVARFRTMVTSDDPLRIVWSQVFLVLADTVVARYSR